VGRLPGELKQFGRFPHNPSTYVGKRKEELLAMRYASRSAPPEVSYV
jgi:hypothetical protein